MGKTVGVVAGSFDPITHGHAWLIQQAAKLVDELHVVIGVNPAKRYHFDEAQRLALVKAVLRTELCPEAQSRTQVHFLKNDLLIHFAASVEATHLVRGIRDVSDFSYEVQMQQVNRKIHSDIQTVYLVPPPELSEVSSSTVRGLVGFTDWEQIVGRYVHPDVLCALREQLACRSLE